MSTRAPRRPRRANAVAFKADAEMAAFLAGMPNASDFIRKAILAQFKRTCPVCHGRGVVARGVGEHYAEVLDAARLLPCAACGETEAIPRDLDTMPNTDRPRWEQFFHGGPYFCSRCFTVAVGCGECSWRLSADMLAAHHRDAHAK